MSDSKSMGDLFLQRRAAAAASSRTNVTNSNALQQTQNPSSGQSNNALLEQRPKKSFADIQREQQQLSQQQSQNQQVHNQYQQRRQHETDDFGRSVRPSGNASGGGGFGSASGGGNRNNESRGGGYGSTNRTVASDSRSSVNDRRGDRPRNQRAPPKPAMPTEQGIIHTLLDKFGFITCADRERELFFHYSEFRGRGGSDELNIGDEVEFMVGKAEERGGGGGRRGDRGGGDRGGGGDGNDKWSAFSVKKLPQGTIHWETEDVPGKRYRGTVEAMARDESYGRRGDRGGGMRDRGGGSGRSGAVDGVICIVAEGEKSVSKGSEKTDEGEEKPEDNPEQIFYTTEDYKSKSSALHRNDIIEFTLVTRRRTKKKYARDITLVQSERERLLMEREKRLMEDATLERGIVASVSVGSTNSGREGRGGGENDNSYSGYLRSVNRTEEIYFNSSHVIIKTEDNDDDKKEGISTTDIRKSMLMEGQEVEFYVVNEVGSGSSSSGRGNNDKSSRGGNSGKSASARQIKILPKGSVKFQHTIAMGVTGIVMECPVASVMDPPFGFGRGGGGGSRKDNRGGTGKSSGNTGKGNQGSLLGKIRLRQPILAVDDQGSIAEVSLRPENYPGGKFAISRTGSETGTWIRPHDVLLFDVVRMVVDGACFAVPTLAKEHTVAAGESATVVDDNDPVVNAIAPGKDGNVGKPAIRLIEPSPCTRAHGTIRSIQDNYGFIQLAERSGSGQSDVYFPLFEVMPGEIQEDLVRNMAVPVVKDDSAGINDGGEGAEKDGMEKDVVQRKGGRIHVEVGMEVAFDLSLQMLTNNTASGDRGMGSVRGDRGGRYGNNKQDKESLRARRVQILPKGTIIEKIPIVSGVKATVAKDDSKRGQKQQQQQQPFVGTLELEESIKMDVDSNNRQRHPLVARLVDAVSEGKYSDEGVTFHDVISDRDAQVVISMVNSRDELEWSYVLPENNDGAVDGDDRHARKLCIATKKKGSEEDEVDESPAVVEILSTSESIKEANEVDEEETIDEEKVEGSASGAPAPTKGRQDSSRKKAKKVKIIKSVRFEKSSFPDMSIGPLGAGDVVTCDIFQSRRTGAYMVENITVLEKAAVVVTDGEDRGNNEKQRKGLSGFVTEVVPSRQFGFITGVDEQGLKTGEHVFFHFREVQSGGANNVDIAQDGSTPARSKKSSGRNSDVMTIRKGDEVKFDVGPGKNGKLNATSISVLPRGTLKLKLTSKSPADNTCTGYIIMEPSHTSLANTPSHNIGLQSGGPAAGGSRWANVRDDKSHKPGSSVKEEGVILLLSDPSHLFSSKPKVDSPPVKMVVDATGDASPNDSTVSSSKAGIADSASESNNKAGTHTEIDDNAAKEDTPSAKEDDNHLSPNIQSSVVGTHLRYRLGSTAARTSGPKRGDLVSFGKTRGAKLVRDVRVEKMGAATSVRGILEDIDVDNDTAVFVSSSPGEDTNNATKKYEIKLTEVVSCGKLLLKDKEQVDGILHDGKVFGVCRTKDIHLASSFGRNSSGLCGLKERPKLNLTVKKELQGMGGKIMAQSRMATGPDGTNGFTPGWTKRVSLHDVVANDGDDLTSSLSQELSAAASEFVPNFSIAASGFETPVETGEGANEGE